MVDVTPQQVRAFWLDEVGPTGWYKSDDSIDTAIRQRFGAVWEHALRGDLHGWCTCAEDALAFLILTDQFPRNMFRGEERAFATDALARRTAKMAVDRRWDMRIAEPQRQFFYVPLMHSESLLDQDRAVRLMAARLPEIRDRILPHARTHREIIRRFGRFPYRNAALGRLTLPSETAFMKSEGYGAVLHSLDAAGTG